MSVRDDLAAAASTVAGVRCSPTYKQLTKQGDALVRFDHTDRDSTGFGFIDTWQVYVMTHQDLATAEAYVEANRDALAAALAAEMVVTLLQPVDFALDTGNVPALLIQGTRAR